MHAIEIDPNVRIAHNRTYTYLDDASWVEQGAAYIVGESESGATWPASVTRVDVSTGYVELDVAWSKGKA